jgi:Uncharacterized protein conserved in bacteria
MIGTPISKFGLEKLDKRREYHKKFIQIRYPYEHRANDGILIKSSWILKKSQKSRGTTLIFLPKSPSKIHIRFQES